MSRVEFDQMRSQIACWDYLQGNTTVLVQLVQGHKGSVNGLNPCLLVEQLVFDRVAPPTDDQLSSRSNHCAEYVAGGYQT